MHNRLSTAMFFFIALLVLLTPSTDLFAAKPVDDVSAGGEAKPDGLPTLDYQTWSGAVNVPDPVAVSVADNGDVYVTQTQRRKIQDLDIRKNTAWTADDVGLSSVDEKRAFYHRELAIGGDQVEQAKHVEDVNEDGQYDYRDLMIISERIHRLVDTDKDGTADQINLFADGFQTEVTGIAAGVMHTHGSVWSTVAPDVWKLTDTTGDGRADKREIMATGFGLHIAYAGHDMHGLTMGPDGRVYWSIGDKGIHVTTREGKTFSYPNQGGVMRCDLDGGHFEVFAHGLRNVQEPAFDQYGNLFGVDNDADMPGERERFVWIVDQMDAGWRCNYQYRGDDYNPWTDEKLWQPAGKDHPAYIIPPIKNYYDGPAGFKFNPGAALSSKYRNYFFLTGAPNGSQYAFQTQPYEDSFRMILSHKIGEGIPIVGLDFGPDGGLYGVDWGGGYPLNQKGSVIRIDVPADELSEQDREDRSSVKRWLSSDFASHDTDTLVGLLKHVDMRVRMAAQFAVVDLEEDKVFDRLLRDQASVTLTKLHCVWGLGQLIRSAKAEPGSLSIALADDDWRVRAQAAKTLGESGKATASDLLALLDDAHPHVRIHAMLALARCEAKKDSGEDGADHATVVETLLRAADACGAMEHYLRHGIVTALTRWATAETLASQSSSASESRRMCSVLALRRQSHPSVAAYLADSSDWIATEAARAIHDDQSIPEAMPALADSLAEFGHAPLALAVRSLNANFRRGRTENADRVMKLISDSTCSVQLRLTACGALQQWLTPPPLDRVDGRRREFPSDRDLNRQTARTVLSDLVRDPDAEIRVAAVKAARGLSIELAPEALLTIANDRKAPDQLRIEALRNLTEGGARTAPVVKTLCQDPSADVASESIRLLAKSDSTHALETIEPLLGSKQLKVRHACIAALAALGGKAADHLLSKLGNDLRSQTLRSSDRLDVWNAMKMRADASPSIKSMIETIRETPAHSQMASEKHIAFSFAGKGGDSQRGERLFRTDLRGQCVRCHRVGKKGSNIGPELTKIAKTRDSAHLLRAVVYPSADIEPKYNTQALLLLDGSIVQGVITKEDDDTTEVLLQSGKKREIPTDEIEDVADKKVSLMPDMTGVLSPSDVRDLVAYLETLR